MAKPKKGQMSKKDKIIELMFNVLPATTTDEITAGIRRKMPEVNKRSVEVALAHLRRNSEKYGWTVPHVGGDSTQTDRYFALLVERDGSYYFDESPKSLGNLHDGSKAIVNRIATESGNQAVMLRIAATETRKRNKKADLLDLALDVEYVARKAKALARNIAEDDGAPKAA